MQTLLNCKICDFRFQRFNSFFSTYLYFTTFIEFSIGVKLGIGMYESA